MQGWLTSRDLTTSFTEVHGKRENYLRAEVVHAEKRIELFVYQDEAGVMIDGKTWKLCERWDFANQDDMIDRLLETTASELRIDSIAPDSA